MHAVARLGDVVQGIAQGRALVRGLVELEGVDHGIAQQRQIGRGEAGILRVEGMHRLVELAQLVAYRRHRPHLAVLVVAPLLHLLGRLPCM
jgi:hypothetical protein